MLGDRNRGYEASIQKKIIHRHFPPRHRRLGLCVITAVDSRRNGIIRSIHSYDVVAQEIDIPNYLRASREVLRSFGRCPPLGDRTIVVFAANNTGAPS
ncbi:MAG: hypothetical protein ACR2RB_18090 [Gammaproteobacteria bacterium]